MTRMTAERTGPGRAGAGELPRHVRLFLRLARRHTPPPVCGVRLERAVGVPMPDGVTLLADHYWPLVDGPAPTVLVRCPYGRGFPYDYMYGGLLAGQGFHVIIQSCRGTAGSGGEFEPFVNEAADGQATVAWLREQDWFTGSLGTIGASYLGFTQWALAADPPPELKTMVIQVSSDNFYGFLYPGGELALESTLTGVAAMVSQHRGFGAFLAAVLRLYRQHRRVERSLPFIDAYPLAVGERVGWFDRWLAHPQPDDPFWDSRRAAPKLAASPPVSLMGGWSDVCIDPTLDLYRRLREAGREVRLLVGPWNHTSGFNKDLPIVFGEALRWLRAHLADDAAAAEVRAEEPVRVWFGATGTPGQWRDLADWPPPGAGPCRWRLSGDQTLTGPEPDAPGAAGDAAPVATAVSAFRYDPADPTPSVGGPSMDNNASGSRRNDALESRTDVVTFTGAPLGEAVAVAGPVSVRLRVRGSSPHFDVFARLCDVDQAGHSWNVCDGLLRVDAGAGHDGASRDGASRDSAAGRDGAGRDGASRDGGGWAEITVPMSSTAHVFGAGHRVRLQVSGGAHPRFGRSTGTGGPFATATAASMVPVDVEIAHDSARPGELSLPVVSRDAGPNGLPRLAGLRTGPEPGRARIVQWFPRTFTTSSRRAPEWQGH